MYISNSFQDLSTKTKMMSIYIFSKEYFFKIKDIRVYFYFYVEIEEKGFNVSSFKLALLVKKEENDFYECIKDENILIENKNILFSYGRDSFFKDFVSFTYGKRIFKHFRNIRQEFLNEAALTYQQYKFTLLFTAGI